MRRIVALGLAGLLVLAVPVKANRAAPPQRPTPTYKLTIEVDPKVTVARLILPAQAPANGGAAPATGGAAPRQGALSLPTVMVAVALTMALAFGGVWVVRRQGSLANAKVPLAILAVVVLALGGAALYADLAVPGRPRPARPPGPPRPPEPPPPAPALDILATLDKVEIHYGGPPEHIHLVIPPALKDRFGESAGPVIRPKKN